MEQTSIVSKVDKKSTKTNTNTKDRRSGKGLVIALSRRIYHLNTSNRHTYYIESESSDNNYYFVRFNPSVFEWCSCKDFEHSKEIKRCKHIFAIEHAIRFGTILEVDRLPSEVQIKRENNSIADKYKNYSIRDLNELEKADIEAENYRAKRQLLEYECDIYEW